MSRWSSAARPSASARAAATRLGAVPPGTSRASATAAAGRGEEWRRGPKVGQGEVSQVAASGLARLHEAPDDVMRLAKRHALLRQVVRVVGGGGEPAARRPGHTIELRTHLAYHFSGDLQAPEMVGQMRPK